MRFLMSLVIVVLLSMPNAWAGCKSDYQDDYQSEVESCKANNDDPDDADELKIYLDNAKSEYDAAIGRLMNKDDFDRERWFSNSYGVKRVDNPIRF
jgi:hypothetical protein